ncbi:response regulator [Granulosicoccus antarcticus]|uniref:response regulator n=1 Tax=Granulosicoccus antarcticus TaxID=437505 RepID=UPI0012FE1773|nr:response regulator [Granulosicoccus antarcticus]
MDILIVEDDEQTHGALMRLVTRMGHKPRGARCARDARDALLYQAPQVLITDWDLGEDQSGVDIADLALELRGSCKVVFWSGNDMPQLKRDSRHLDVTAYISKPSSLANLRSELSQVLPVA